LPARRSLATGRESDKASHSPRSTPTPGILSDFLLAFEEYLCTFQYNNLMMKRTNEFVVVPQSDKDKELLRRLLDASAALWNEINYERSKIA